MYSKKFRDSFSRMEGHFHILEQRVPVELQMEYFKYSENVTEANRPSPSLIEDGVRDPVQHFVDGGNHGQDREEIFVISNWLPRNPSVRTDCWRNTPSIRTRKCRLGYMALMESRISLESDFSDEKQIYISTGLGGKGRSCVSMS